MSRQYNIDLLMLASVHNIPSCDLPLYVNGCSGGLSWAYQLAFGREISCKSCCDMHDLLYTLGAIAGTRREADQALRDCARRAGSFPPGARGVFRKAIRWGRARVMYAAVRLFGGSYWGGG